MNKFILAIATASLIALGACSSDDSGTNNTTTDTKGGIVGTWVSSGSNVALLLKTYFKTDSLVATFNENGSYTVLQYDSAKAVQTLSGTYTVSTGSKDTLGGTIYNITVNQTAPSTLTATGIYVVNKTASPNTMSYEIIAQGAGIAPTPTTGFGSSKTTTGTSLGTLNIQKYVKR